MAKNRIESDVTRQMVEVARDDIIRIVDRYYILATSNRVDDRARVLKRGESFAVFDRYGDIHPFGLGEYGLYHEGTRFLSRFELYVDETRPLLLSSTVKEDNIALAVDLANPDLHAERLDDGAAEGEPRLPANTLHMFRLTYLWDGVCHTRLRVRNYGLDATSVRVSLRYDADFIDIFEVRGLKRQKRGERLPTEVEGSTVVLGYRGLDRTVRRSRLEWSPEPDRISETEAAYELRLDSGAEATLYTTVSFEIGERRARARPVTFEVGSGRVAEALRSQRSGDAEVVTSNEQFNNWLHRSIADLHMMMTSLPTGLYPYAGVPWFSTPFGRDGLITAFETLWVNPQIARGVLAYLADTQATDDDPERDAEPGKILHETRSGELAALGEIPFARYYGTVDATPLFVMLAGAYHERTADTEFIRSIWPNVRAALHWIESRGDLNDDGFTDYARRSPTGLTSQGWKDSQDSIVHADGRLAEGPIALCEVQAYVYAARRQAARLAALFGEDARALRLEEEADRLRERFDEAFWLGELSTYALAIDGHGEPCRVRASNAGHCLFAGIAEPDRAAPLAEALLRDEMFSGWGIRTLGASEVRYNPMSYHNGSVWPHDNALIACGLARYGLREEAARVLRGMFDASLFLELRRMPELFCGFDRRSGEGPTLYPVACLPQSWAAAAPFALLEACMGMHMHAIERCVTFSHPQLPEFVDWLQMRNLRIGDAVVDLALERHDRDVILKILRKEGKVDVIVTK